MQKRKIKNTKTKDEKWFFSDNNKNKIHNISDKDIYELIKLNNEEKEWQKAVQQEVINRNEMEMTQGEILIDFFRMINAKGTMIDYPFGQKLITFGSTGHLFRGERQIFRKSIPSLNRKIELLDKKSKELYRAIANLRIIRFSDFIWNFDIVPFWEAKMSDVNYKVLAQHYGFETSLLDLTNDFNIALFFATCKYVKENDCYVPLTEKDIEKSEKTKWGVIYHSPNYMLDYYNGDNIFRIYDKFKPEEIKNKKFEIDSGKFDGVAFQTGFQPFMRCSMQSGYVLPMREDNPIQLNNRFEKIHFRQSPKLSEKVFEMMENGKKVMPFEGINKAKKVIDEIKTTLIFTEKEIEEVYYNEVDKEIFSSLDEFKYAITSYKINENYDNVKIVEKIENNYLTNELKQEINEQYNEKDLLKYIGGTIYTRPEDREYLRQKCIQIYGKEI